MLKRGENKSVLNMKRALHSLVSLKMQYRFDHGGNGGVPLLMSVLDLDYVIADTGLTANNATHDIVVLPVY